MMTYLTPLGNMVQVRHANNPRYNKTAIEMTSFYQNEKLIID